jgi:hypothetical protein
MWVPLHVVFAGSHSRPERLARLVPEGIVPVRHSAPAREALALADRIWTGQEVEGRTGRRYRKDGLPGKRQETLAIRVQGDTGTAASR